MPHALEMNYFVTIHLGPRQGHSAFSIFADNIRRVAGRKPAPAQCAALLSGWIERLNTEQPKIPLWQYAEASLWRGIAEFAAGDPALEDAAIGAARKAASIRVALLRAGFASEKIAGDAANALRKLHSALAKKPGNYQEIFDSATDALTLPRAVRALQPSPSDEWQREWSGVFKNAVDLLRKGPPESQASASELEKRVANLDLTP